ncbi:transmembrane protein 161A isoform X5 [Mirounga angustirostris]|uniref:transmembrane protein 161A isoform X5 n=1 Tax=Mirounga angustirostris TaxID=9716 RepID=UPI00313D207B
MAVLGVQLVVTLLTATLMHRLAPHCSFARWLLCNGSLFRYKHPTEEELRALEGKPRPRGRKERWANGYSEEKPLSVPRDAPFQLETCPLTAVDALVLRFFLEYQWFVDFAVYSGGVYVFTEAYYYVLGPAKETNIAVVWCLLTVAFSVYPSSGCPAGLASLTQNLQPLLKTQGWDWAFLLHTSFLSPLIILWLWTKPIARDFLHQAPLGEVPFSLLSDSAFDSLRLWLLVALCLLRLAVTRPHLQAYLCLAKARVEQLRREAGRIEAREIQRRVVRVYCYVTVVSLQYLTPLILTLSCTLLLKTLGGYSWGPGPVPMLSPARSSAQDRLGGPGEDEAQQTAARIAGALGSLLTPLFLRAVLTFLIWWTAACQLLSSLFGLYFHRQLAGS